MAEQAEVLTTRDALAIVGIHPDAWKELTSGGTYRPRPVRRGVAREFDTFDMVGAFCVGWLVDRHVKPSVAGRIAVAIVWHMRRDHSVMTLSAWRVKPNAKKIVVAERAPNDASTELFRFDVGEIRVRMLNGIREKLREKSTNLSGTFPTHPAGRAGSEVTLDRQTASSSKGYRPAVSKRTAP